MTTEKTMLKIRREAAGKNDADPPSFAVMLNPASYTRETQFDLTCSRKLNQRQPETLSLPELVLDGTGVVPVATGGPRTVVQQLDALNKVLAPVPDAEAILVRPVVVLTWGTLYFRGRIESYSVTYTLFAPNGAPLRAKLALSFAEPETSRKAPKPKKAPPLNSQIQCQGESLPNISFKKFRDPARAVALARLNELDSLRNIPADTWLKY